MDNTAYNITKAIGYVENNGKPNIKKPVKGKTGEMASIFQYEKPTWDAYSKQILGKDAPLTPDNEVHVTQAKVEQWLKQGMTPQEIFSAWNAGPAEKDAYNGKFSNGHPSVGVNPKYGVKYDVPGYVNKAMSYFDKFNQDSQSQPQQSPQATQAPPPQMAMSTPPQSKPGTTPGLIQSLLPQKV